jgi:hypothetical protein
MTAPAKPELSLAGRTLRWTFSDGPTASKTYEHTFNDDGTVVYREVGGPAEQKPDAGSKPKASIKYASYEVAPGMHFVSYLSPDNGYTLTVLADTNKKLVYAIASGGKEWYPLEGKLE